MGYGNDYKDAVQFSSDYEDRQKKSTRQYVSSLQNRIANQRQLINQLQQKLPKKTKWLNLSVQNSKGNIYRCNACGYCVQELTKFCPDCGADMQKTK